MQESCGKGMALMPISALTPKRGVSGNAEWSHPIYPNVGKSPFFWLSDSAFPGCPFI
jgi:hypothetical protein